MSETTATPCFFKQIDEKHINQEVSQMLWNPRMDLIALAFSNGDIHLYRMNWQRVWSFSSPQQHLTVTSMAWRPDGKILAVSYSNGHLRLIAVEDAKKIFTFNCKEPITHLYWLQENEEMCKKRESETFYEDLSSSQLPKPISYDLISQLFEKTNNKDFPDNLFIKETKNLTYLVCCFGTSINIFVYGYFLLVEANLDLVESHLHYKQLQSCFLSDDTSLISTLGLTHENLLVYSILDSKFLQDNHVQIKMVSTKFGMLFSMLTAVKNVIKEMEELWEDILVEMDQKFQLYALEKYSNNNKGGVTASATQNNANGTTNNNNNQSDSSLVNDFMLLYSFGSCSEHFKNFLLNELTEKGLKKLELSVENYYSSIQRLLSGNFHQISLCMFYHLNELYGMTKCFDKFKIFSFTESIINDVLNDCASLILKAQELNFVIDQNMKEIKIFFKWLHSSIVRLSDDHSSDMIQFNEEMENSILDFIQNTFKDAQTINMEKVGQYLKQEPLKVQLTEENSWQTFLKSKLTGKESQNLFCTKKEKSLVGCFEDFKSSLNDCFKNQALNTQTPFQFIKQYNIHKFNSLKDASQMIMSYKCFQNTMITGLLMAKTNNECYILKHSNSANPDIKAFIINLTNHTIDMGQLSLQDVYIYSERYVTLLGTDSKSQSHTYLIQFDLDSGSSVLSDLIEVTSYSNGESSKPTSSKSPKEAPNVLIKAEKLNCACIVKCIKKLKSSSLCVSSSRKVAALLSHTKHRVKIFELECEDEDEEMEEDDNEGDEASEMSENNDSTNQNGIRNGTHATMASPSPSLNESTTSSFKQSSNSNQQLMKLMTKTHSAGSASSLAPSICSSTGATIATSVTLENSQSNNSLMRGKRKKNFDDDTEDDDDQNTDAASTINTDSADISNFNEALKNNLINETNEIGSNQNGNQQLNQEL